MNDIIKNIIPVISGVALTLFYNHLYNNYLYNRECKNRARQFISEYLGMLERKVYSSVSYKEYILDIIKSLKNKKLGYISAIQSLNFYINDFAKDNAKNREIKILKKLYLMTNKERNYIEKQIDKISK